MKKIYAGLLLVICIITSCIKNTLDDFNSIKGVKVSSTWSLPLINAEAGISDFLNSLNSVTIIPDKNKLLVLTFLGKDSLPEGQFFNLPNVNVNRSFSMDGATILFFENSGSLNQQIAGEENISLQGNELIDRILVKDGIINMSVTSSFKHDCKVKITYPGIKLNGVELVDSFNFIYTGGSQNIPRSIVLDNYELDFTKNGSTHNVMPYTIDVSITRNPSNTTETSDAITVNQTVDIDEYKRAEGYFGEQNLLDVDETNVLTMFDKKLDGTVYFKDPKLRIEVDNSIGMPIVGKFYDFIATSGNGTPIPIVIDQFADTFTVNHTTVIGQTAKTTYIINKDNSNIAEVLSSAPQNLKYKVNFTANYDNHVTSNILYDNSKIKVDAIFELPFDAQILNYRIENQGAFAVGNELDNMNKEGIEIEFAELHADLANELPLSAYIQVYFDDSLTGVIKDSLYKEPILLGSTVDSDGEIITKSTSLTNTYLSADSFKKLAQANRYRVAIRLITSENNGNNPYVKFYEQQKIKIKLGVKTKIKYQTPE